MIGRTNAGAGGTGATLTVNAPAGVSVIATNSATNRTYTRTANSSGVAVFRGLSTGTYSVHITDGTTTSDNFTANVVADYVLTVKFFAAYINVTYPSGSTCTCTDGTTTFTATDTSGSYQFVVPNIGTWTVNCTNGSQSTSSSVLITADEQSKSVTLSYFAATIAVSYPSGSTCTCSNGSTVYTAGNTSGSWTFTVPRAGTWTVTATNGSQTKSQAVSITTTGQSASVTLSYILYLFKSGTGALVDWTAAGYSGISKCTITNEYIQGNSSYGYYYPGFGTSNAIDLTNYTTLHCTARAYNTAAYTGITMTLAVQNPKNTTVSSTQVTSADYSTFTLDVSKLNGGHYIVLYEVYDYNATIIATNVWLT